MELHPTYTTLEHDTMPVSLTDLIEDHLLGSHPMAAASATGPPTPCHVAEAKERAHGHPSIVNGCIWGLRPEARDTWNGFLRPID
jgi:hypothetical protein